MNVEKYLLRSRRKSLPRTRFIVYFFMYASFREETKKAANAALRYEAFNSFFQKASMRAFN